MREYFTKTSEVTTSCKVV